METQIEKGRVEALSGTLGFYNGYTIGRQGRSGGIGIFWNKSIKVEILGSSVYHIDCSVTDENSDTWRITCVYGEAQTHLRHQTWDTVRIIANSSDLLWLCLGDFNEVLRQNKHEGIGERSNAQIQGFRDIIDTCMLLDIGFTGQFWTYEKRVRGGSYPRVRLDRALGSADWCSKFPLASVSHETAACSDHRPIFLSLDGGVASDTVKKRFMHETMWESHEQWREEIESRLTYFGSGETITDLRRKTTEISKGLIRWSKTTFGSFRQEIKTLNTELQRLQSDPQRTGPSHVEIKISDRLVELYHREELMWRQRARIEWLSAGDKNSKFFYLCASISRKKI